MRPTPPAFCRRRLSRYCDFFSVSCVAEDDEELLGEELLGEALLAPPLAEPDVLGCEALEPELGLLVLGEAALEPPDADPEAEPDFAVSLEADPLIPAEELDEEPGLEGEDDALPPLEGEELGEVALLEPEEPGAEVVRLESPLSHAARPNASATANASVDSFMCPPWLGYRDRRATSAPDLTH